jgi:galactonate dehydratase
VKFILDTFASVTVTPNTTWVFAVLSDGEGNSTTVEIGSRQVSQVVKGMASVLDDEDISEESEIESLLGLTPDALRRDATSATAVSGLRTAVSQLCAMRSGVSLAEHLGARPTERVQLYANINRSLFATDRTPADFGRVAERAATAGFSAFKCAPFDEVRPPSSPDRILDEAATGLARVRAVREAVGPDSTVLVDCHSRFERDTAPLIVEELAMLNLGWFEEPVQPTSDPEDLAAIARWAPMPVAGGESGYGVEFFDDLLDTEAVSVVMPDIKHCGGAVEAVTIGRSTGTRAKGFSMHSPSGPMSLLASGHATAAVPTSMPLEHAVYEADWRADLLVPRERVEGGHLYLTSSPGLGAELDWELVQRFGRVWD